jgi:hypothetical protein
VRGKLVEGYVGEELGVLWCCIWKGSVMLWRALGWQRTDGIVDSFPQGAIVSERLVDHRRHRDDFQRKL